MFIGIIAEGKSDLAVITNILRGKSGIHSSEIQYLQPELDYDETDLNKMSAKQFSNWALVRETCIQKRKLSDFFSIDEERFIIVQIDTAEACEIHYDVERPAKRNNLNYSAELRNNVINKINEWLENQFSEQVFYAIAIEEMEAWVLTIYTDKKDDTCRFTNPKEELYRTLNRKFSKKQKKVLSLKDELIKSDKLSKAFRKLKILNKCVALNESLNLFCESLERRL